MFNFFAIICDSIRKIIDGFVSFLLHDDIGTVQPRFPAEIWESLTSLYTWLKYMQRLIQIFYASEQIPQAINYFLYSPVLNQIIYLSDDLWICEEGVCCIGDLCSTLNLDKTIGDGFGSIIWYDHGIGSMLHFARSDGYIWIVQMIDKFECFGIC